MRRAWLAFLAVLLLAAAAEARDPAVPRAFQRLHPCPSTGLKTGACPGWVRDHLIPLCAGGPDTVDNMMWQTVDAAKAKDKLELALCARLRACEKGARP